MQVIFSKCANLQKNDQNLKILQKNGDFFIKKVDFWEICGKIGRGRDK
jgi:hypothetical protein